MPATRSAKKDNVRKHNTSNAESTRSVGTMKAKSIARKKTDSKIQESPKTQCKPSGSDIKDISQRQTEKKKNQDNKKKANEKPSKEAATENDEAVPLVHGPYDDIASTITDPGWRNLLQPILGSDQFRRIINYLNSEHALGKEIYPPKDLIFNSLNLTPLDKVKVVIIGQDPYHDGTAHGLAFSVLPEVEKLPSSLRTLYKELHEDPDTVFEAPKHGCLVEWAKRGVLLLNCILTVEARKPSSHGRCGWAWFTDQMLQLLASHHDGLIFILWGKYAQKKKSIIGENHIILEGAHPSGMTCGKFYGCRHFSAVNNALQRNKKDSINWQL